MVSAAGARLAALGPDFRCRAEKWERAVQLRSCFAFLAANRLLPITSKDEKKP